MDATIAEPAAMLRTLKALFEEKIERYAAPAPPEDALPVAIAALMFEIAKSDDAVGADERHAILHAIASACDVDENDMAALLDTASDAADDSVSFYEFTVVINEHLSREKKIELLEMLWRIARADGRVDHYEEYYIRKIADLLRLSHRDFIRTKLATD